MSKKLPTKNQPKEHGTTASYVVGFILSLIFTAIPYYMVVNKTISGTALLATILGFAVLQMFVQIFFFLHLGRGPKPLYNVAFFVSTVGIILVVVVGSIFIMDHLHYNMAMTPQDLTKKLSQDEAISQVGGEKTGACTDLGDNHQVIIHDGKVNPARTEARLCDTLTFINEDSKTREIAFGPHPDQGLYGGETEVKVPSNYPVTITLNQLSSNFLFRDRLDPATAGYFTVTPQE
jgi:cytochrome o ubiquinol oxidase operon protein cyoD